MTVVRGEHNSWQTGASPEATAIEMCGSYTGHAVRAVAFCDTPKTAKVLVEALALLKRMHDHWIDPSKEDNLGRSGTINEDMLAAGRLLERAGLVE